MLNLTKFDKTSTKIFHLNYLSSKIKKWAKHYPSFKYFIFPQDYQSSLLINLTPFSLFHFFTVNSDYFKWAIRILPVEKNNKINLLPILTNLANRSVVVKTIMDLKNNFLLSVKHIIRLKKSCCKLKKLLWLNLWCYRSRGQSFKYR